MMRMVIVLVIPPLFGVRAEIEILPKSNFQLRMPLEDRPGQGKYGHGLAKSIKACVLEVV